MYNIINIYKRRTNMARYIINKNAKSKAEEGIIYQLGGPEMIKKYDQGRRLGKNSPKIIKAIAFPAIAIALIGFLILHNHTVTLAGFGLMFITMIYGFTAEIIRFLKQREAVRLSPDLKQMAESYEVERLEISPYGVSHIFLHQKGDEDSSDSYLQKYIESDNINEILRCDALGVYIFCGKTDSYYTSQNNALKKDPEKLKWDVFGSPKTSLRVYDYWENELSGTNDIKNTIAASFNIPVREISVQEAAEIIRRDELLKLESRKNSSGLLR